MRPSISLCLAAALALVIAFGCRRTISESGGDSDQSATEGQPVAGTPAGRPSTAQRSAPPSPEVSGRGSRSGQKGGADTDAQRAAGAKDKLAGGTIVKIADHTPKQSAAGLVLRDAQRCQPGYTLFTAPRLAEAVLLDEEGRTVHTWRDADALRWEAVKLLEDGDLIVVGVVLEAESDSSTEREPRFLARFDWNGDVVWRKPLQAQFDIDLTPSGDLVTIVADDRSIPKVNKDADVRDERITNVSPGGDVLAGFSIYDAVKSKPKLFELLTVTPARADSDSSAGLFQAVSVEWMNNAELARKDPIYALDNVLVCFRRQDRVAIFDGKKKELIWAWGTLELEGPRDAHLLENGHILVFDAGSRRRISRVLEVDPLTDKIVRQYRAKGFYSSGRSGCRRLANGNTLVSASSNGEIFEITSDGDVVWSYFYPEKSANQKPTSITDARRYDADAIARILSQASAAEPQEETP